MITHTTSRHRRRGAALAGGPGRKAQQSLARSLRWWASFFSSFSSLLLILVFLNMTTRSWLISSNGAQPPVGQQHTDNGDGYLLGFFFRRIRLCGEEGVFLGLGSTPAFRQDSFRLGFIHLGARGWGGICICLALRVFVRWVGQGESKHVVWGAMTRLRLVGSRWWIVAKIWFVCHVPLLEGGRIASNGPNTYLWIGSG